MSYASNHLKRNETIVSTHRPTALTIVPGILWFPVLGVIPKIIRMMTTELTLTNSRVIGKAGVIKSGSIDCPLDKIQNVTVTSGFFGKIFGYGNIMVETAGSGTGGVLFRGLAKAESFKQQIMQQIDVAQEEKTKAQAQEMAKAMAAAIKK